MLSAQTREEPRSRLHSPGRPQIYLGSRSFGERYTYIYILIYVYMYMLYMAPSSWGPQKTVVPCAPPPIGNTQPASNVSHGISGRWLTIFWSSHVSSSKHLARNHDFERTLVRATTRPPFRCTPRMQPGSGYGTGVKLLSCCVIGRRPLGWKLSRS